MRTLGVILAVLFFLGAIPAGMRAERASHGDSLGRLLWESARFLLAVTAGTALLVLVIWG